jgi:methyl-accepting chemotaxis protein
MDPNSPEMLASKRFVMQGSYMIRMLDTALSMLGPDIELLSDILQDLGAKHGRYGVKREMYNIMGDALIKVLQEMLGGNLMTDSCVASWKQTYKELSRDMIKAMKQKQEVKRSTC